MAVSTLMAIQIQQMQSVKLGPLFCGMNMNYIIGFEVLEMITKTTLLWDMKPCSLVGGP
jgi:hypothetical protein